MSVAIDQNGSVSTSVERWNKDLHTYKALSGIDTKIGILMYIGHFFFDNVFALLVCDYTTGHELFLSKSQPIL